MGGGRKPCCDKTGLKKGPWTPAEDLRLISFIRMHGHGNWRALPKQAGLLRCGKSCRLRWTNYLRPDIKRGNFTQEEEETIIKLHESLGNKWSKIASYLPGRTDNEIKNVWNTHLKKRLELKEPNLTGNESNESSITSDSSSSNSFVSYGNQDKEMENGEQEHPGSMSQSPTEVHDMEILGNNQDPLVELVPIEVSVNIWEMFDDSIDNEREKVGDTSLNRQLEGNPTSSPTNKPKELSNSSSFSSTTCSYSSDVPNSNQVDASKLEEQANSLFNYGRRPFEVHDTLDPSGEILEIPFEPNLNFWDMLDEDPSFFTSNEVPICEVEAHQHSTIEEEHKREFECRRWVTYLENELGLLATSDQNQEILTWDATDPLIPSSSCDETLWKAEIDPVATYFQSSSPQSVSL